MEPVSYKVSIDAIQSIVRKVYKTYKDFRQNVAAVEGFITCACFTDCDDLTELTLRTTATAHQRLQKALYGIKQQ